MIDLDGVALLACNPTRGSVNFNESRLVLSNDIGSGIKNLS